MQRARVWVASAAVGQVLLAGGLWALSSQLLFPFHQDERWEKPFRAACDAWLDTVAYADLQSGEKTGTHAVDLRCEDAVSLPGLDVVTRQGIHLRIYDSPLVETAPILLHVHGASGNILHGARYASMATRLGFALAVMELSNHGMSRQDGRGVSYGCREQDDVNSVLQELATRFPLRRVLVHATSMGSMSSMLALAQHTPPNVGALALESPIPSINTLLSEAPEVPWVPAPVRWLVLKVASARAGCDMAVVTPENALSRITLPTLVEHATMDTLVTDGMAQRIHDGLTAAPWKRLVVHARGVHSAVWNGDPRAYEAELLELWSHAVKLAQ